ncbi:MAG TPA: putative baseplate assembly protein [Frankiaceae bacterium]|nr:putative baseplate assembly protein [Frankiaceae bacterium]
MTLPAPKLDDRTFQDLVDDAKRYIQVHCPEWTDHNVSDPGVTLVEAVAQMVEALVYRLNQVPDRLYLKFLELMGVELQPPTPAEGPVTFWLSAPRPVPVEVPKGTVVATARDEHDEASLYRTTRRLVVKSCAWRAAAVQRDGGPAKDVTQDLRVATAVRVFRSTPQPGDALLVGLSAAVPCCAVRLQVECGGVRGLGVLPGRPPLRWEAWTTGGWAPCTWTDHTGGLNQSGRVVVHVPDSHVRSTLAGRTAGWLRAVVVAPGPGEPPYDASPLVSGIAAETVGGTVRAVNAETVEDELLGLAEGVPGQRFALRRGPVVQGDAPIRVEVRGGAEWEPWCEVDEFDRSEPDDPHVVVDRACGEVVFGSAVREPDGRVRHYGAVPPRGAPVRASYDVGGGRAGNARRGRVTVLRTTVPFVTAVENLAPMLGGVDRESVDDAKRRGPAILRARHRAVTASDYEELARTFAPKVLRAHCVRPAGWSDPIRVLLVPDVPVADDGGVPFEDLVLDADTISEVAAMLDEHRCLSARLLVEPPRYQGVTVVAELRAAPGADADRVRGAALTAVNRYVNPLVGGPSGLGWPFGRDLHVGDVYALLQHVPGVAYVEAVRLYPCDPRTKARGDPAERVAVGDGTLVYSVDPHVDVGPVQ